MDADPTLLADTEIGADGTLRGRGEVPGAAVWFDGHFPERPLLPAVAMLRALIGLIEGQDDAPAGELELKNVRFRSLVVPGASLAATISSATADGRRKLELTADGAVACSGSLYVRGG